jgi:hypothetical protein
MISAAITEALERIRAREGQPGYEGPKITSYIRNVAAIQYLMVRGGDDRVSGGLRMILQGDCLARLAEIPDESVHCCATSPARYI